MEPLVAKKLPVPPFGTDALRYLCVGWQAGLKVPVGSPVRLDQLGQRVHGVNADSIHFLTRGRFAAPVKAVQRATGFGPVPSFAVNSALTPRRPGSASGRWIKCWLLRARHGLAGRKGHRNENVINLNDSMRP